MTLNEVLKNTNYELSLFSEEGRNFVEGTIFVKTVRGKNSVLWFFDFVYRLRNALFHEIIDPLDEEWQVIFKNAYLVLKEIVDLNIAAIETR